MHGIGLDHPIFEVGMEYMIKNYPELFTRNNIPKNITFYQEFKAGDTFPVIFKADGDFMSLESAPQTLTFKCDVFVRANKDTILFSLDQNKWMELSELFTGNLNVMIIQQGDDSKGLVDLFVNTVKPQEILATETDQV